MRAFQAFFRDAGRLGAGGRSRTGTICGRGIFDLAAQFAAALANYSEGSAEHTAALQSQCATFAALGTGTACAGRYVPEPGCHIPVLTLLVKPQTIYALTH